MIDLRTETRLSLSQAARLIPPTRQDKKVHVSTIGRWIQYGVKGVRLEAVRIGGRWITSHEAIERFSAALTSLHAAPSTAARPAKQQQTERQRRRQDRVEQELTALGV